MRITAEMGYGGRRGRLYIARITGTNDRYRFAREFLVDAEPSFSRSGRTGHISAEVGPGLYEARSSNQSGERLSYTLVAEIDGELRSRLVSEEEARRCAAMLDDDATSKALWESLPPPKESLSPWDVIPGSDEIGDLSPALWRAYTERRSPSYAKQKLLEARSLELEQGGDGSITQRVADLIGIDLEATS